MQSLKLKGGNTTHKVEGVVRDVGVPEHAWRGTSRDAVSPSLLCPCGVSRGGGVHVRILLCILSLFTACILTLRRCMLTSTCTHARTHDASSPTTLRLYPFSSQDPEFRSKVDQLRFEVRSLEGRWAAADKSARKRVAAAKRREELLGKKYTAVDSSDYVSVSFCERAMSLSARLSTSPPACQRACLCLHLCTLTMCVR